MNTVFIILLLLSLAGLGVGLINPAIFKWTRKKVGWIFGSASIVLFVLIGVSGSSSMPTAIVPAPVVASSTDTASAPATKPVATAPVQSAPAKVAPTPAPHQPVVLLQVSGNGQKSTQTFTAPSSWTMDYTYDCSSFGSRGNFQVYLYKADGSISFLNGPNELGMNGSDIEYYHQAGQFYLEVNSECSWTVTAKG